MSVTESKNNPKIDRIIEEISQLNLGEVSELVENLKKKHNIQEQVVMNPNAAATAPTDGESEKKADKVSVKLVEIGNQKIQVYKTIQNVYKKILGEEINLKQAMDITKKEDKIIFSDIPQDRAKDIKKELEEEKIGAKIEII